MKPVYGTCLGLLLTFWLSGVESAPSNSKASCNCEQVTPQDKILTCKFPVEIYDGKQPVRAYCGDIEIASCHMKDGNNSSERCHVKEAKVWYISVRTLSLQTWVDAKSCSCRMSPEHSGEFEDCVCTRSKTFGHTFARKEEEDVNVAARVGGVFGGFIAVCLLVALAFFIYQKCGGDRLDDADNTPQSAEPSLASGDVKVEPRTPEPIISSEKVRLVQAGKSPVIIPEIIADGDAAYPDETVMRNIPFIDASQRQPQLHGKGWIRMGVLVAFCCLLL